MQFLSRPHGIALTTFCTLILGIFICENASETKSVKFPIKWSDHEQGLSWWNEYFIGEGMILGKVLIASAWITHPLKLVKILIDLMAN